jgi:hypothetical protein
MRNRLQGRVNRCMNRWMVHPWPISDDCLVPREHIGKDKPCGFSNLDSQRVELSQLQTAPQMGRRGGSKAGERRIFNIEKVHWPGAIDRIGLACKHLPGSYTSVNIRRGLIAKRLEQRKENRLKTGNALDLVHVSDKRAEHG